MNKTIRRIKGFKVEKDGTAAHFLLETVDGADVVFDIVEEAMFEFALNLVNARTRALFNAEGGLPTDVTPDGTLRRGAIRAHQFKRARYPDPKFELFQFATEGGGIFEFLVPVEQSRKPS